MVNKGIWRSDPDGFGVTGVGTLVEGCTGAVMSKLAFLASDAIGGDDDAWGRTGEPLLRSGFGRTMLMTGDKGGGGRSAALSVVSIGGVEGRMADNVAVSRQEEPCSLGSRGSLDS